jgi:dienelactone hydrolase
MGADMTLRNVLVGSISKGLIFSGVWMASLAEFSAADASTKKHSYTIDGEKFEGVLAVPQKTSPQAARGLPGILMVHNWMGVTSNTDVQAQALADLGFVVLAADIYGAGQRPKDSKEAGAFAGKYKGDRTLFRKRLVGAFEELKKQKGIQKTQLFGVGYCFGGTGVVELARSGADVKGVVSFHGGLDSPTPNDGKNVTSRVLALHGADDPFVPAKDLEAFESEMRTHKIDWQLVKFGGAVHSFTDKDAGADNSKGAAYNALADARSWEMMKNFFEDSAVTLAK